MRKIGISILMPLLSVMLSIPALAWDMPERLIPVGEVYGITVGGDGVYITDLGERDGAAPAKEAGLLPGDRLVELSGVRIENAQDLVSAVSGSDGNIKAVYERGGDTYETVIEPLRTGGECYIGVWVRDGISGIGTVTFYDPDSGVFGALGHPVSDENIGENGELKSCILTGIVRGKVGEPGELSGAVGDEHKGNISVNSSVGIFGTMDEPLFGDSIPVAEMSEIHAGKAIIIASPDGVRKTYEAEITRVYPESDSVRNMMIRITDPELISLTGGIVQGCSGSPIIQDGKLVGAVTHVLISDPTRGYAVSIGRMLDECAERGIYDIAA